MTITESLTPIILFLFKFEFFLQTFDRLHYSLPWPILTHAKTIAIFSLAKPLLWHSLVLYELVARGFKHGFKNPTNVQR
jgi:hypothetical protein